MMRSFFPLCYKMMAYVVCFGVGGGFMILGFSFKNAQCTVDCYFECQRRPMQGGGGGKNRRESKEWGKMALNMLVFCFMSFFCLRLIVFSSSFPK